MTDNPSPDIRETEIEAAFDLSMSGRVHGCFTSKGTFTALPPGYQVHNLEQWQERPNRIRATIMVREVKALSDYLTRFGHEHAVAFADWRERKILAQIDYHSPKGAPSHCSHSCTFSAERSSPWTAWAQANDKQKSQMLFGRFLEEMAMTVVEPDAASIVEVCMNLEAVKQVSFKSAVRLADGFRQLEYIETSGDARGALRVPEMITVLVPIFEGMEPQRVDVRLRYRFTDGNLVMWITIDNMEDIERLAFDRCIDALSLDQPKLPIYRAIL